MAPFHFQIECVDNYSAWGLEAVRNGAWIPPDLIGVVAFTELQARLAKTEADLEAFQPGEVNACSGKELDIDMTHISPQATAFTSKTLLLSFLLSNFTSMLSPSTTSFARATCL